MGENVKVKNIVFVSHCLLNTATKVMEMSKAHNNEEEKLRKSFLIKAVENDLHIIQLPCPEFNLYGSMRWGHSKDQFDNPFYREGCKKMLEPYILQMKEYLSKCDKFKVLGIIGVEGSPSCGVNLTYCGNWGGELSTNPHLNDMLKGIYPKKEKGVFMEVLQEMMEENRINIDMLGLNEYEKIFL